MSTEREQTFLFHLGELRNRILRSLACVLVVFIPLSLVSGELYSALATPLVNQFLPENRMIATEVAATFIVPIKLAFYLAIMISMPYVLYQAWAFIAPGLYNKERRIALPLLCISIFLFYLGILFAYFVIFPVVFGFFIAITPEGVTVMTDISRYLDFIMKLSMAFGLAFEVPVVTLLVVAAGITTPDKLRAGRPYIIVVAFVIGMLLTPPDILSQILLAVPVWLLFELGLLISVRYGHHGQRKDTETP